MNTALRRRFRLVASITALAGALAWLPACAAGQDLAALACLAGAGLAALAAWRLGATPAAPPDRTASVDERWQQAGDMLDDVAEQARRLVLLASAELEHSRARAPQFAALTEQMRLLARHSTDSAALVRLVDPQDLPRRNP